MVLDGANAERAGAGAVQHGVGSAGPDVEQGRGAERREVGHLAGGGGEGGQGGELGVVRLHR